MSPKQAEERYRTNLGKLRNELRAASKTMKEIASSAPLLFDRLNELAEETRCEVRRYGRESFAWPNHELLGAVDPWPGTRYPKACVCILFLGKLAD